MQPTLARWFTPAFGEAQPAELARIGEIIRTTSPIGFAGCANAVPLINTTTRLKEIACPSLVIVGSEDTGTPPAMAREIQDNAPGSRLIVIEHAAHLSNVEQSAYFNQALLPFLAGC